MTVSTYDVDVDVDVAKMELEFAYICNNDFDWLYANEQTYVILLEAYKQGQKYFK